MLAKTLVEHNGIVIEKNNELVKVHIIDETPCSSCNASDVCAVTDRKDKIITIQEKTGKYFPGDKVIIVNEPSLGSKALFLGYILPFLLVISSFFIASFLIKSELSVGLISIFILIPYYFLLYIFRNKIKRTFEFKIKKSF